MRNSSARFDTVDEYIAAFPEAVQRVLRELRQTIRAAAPQAEEKIAYGMPTFTLHGNLIHFAAHKAHIGLYPTPSGVEAFQEALAGYKNAKGSVQFPLDQPLPLELIRRIVEFRVQENLQKAALKAKPKKKSPPAP